MANKLEKLDQKKFKPLNISAQLSVRGGEATAGSVSKISTEFDEQGRRRDYYKKVGSDDYDGKNYFLYDVSYYWGEWY